MNEFEIEPFKSPKILGDVFESIIGAIFKDSGIEVLIDVLKTLLAPFVLYVAKFSKNIHKEPKEDFNQLSNKLNMKPMFSAKEKIDVPLSKIINRDVDPMEDEVFEAMCQSEIIINNGEVMTVGYGNSKDQAERNASILGLQWLQKHRTKEIEELIENSQFSLSLKACFMQHSNMQKYIPTKRNN